MSDPPTTHELCDAAGLAARQAADIHDRLSELRELVDLSGVELPPATTCIRASCPCTRFN